MTILLVSSRLTHNIVDFYDTIRQEQIDKTHKRTLISQHYKDNNDRTMTGQHIGLWTSMTRHLDNTHRTISTGHHPLHNTKCKTSARQHPPVNTHHTTPYKQHQQENNDRTTPTGQHPPDITHGTYQDIPHTMTYQANKNDQTTPTEQLRTENINQKITTRQHQLDNINQKPTTDQAYCLI